VKQFLDRENFGIVYKFVPTPVWFTVEVDVDPSIAKAVPLLAERMQKINLYLDSLFEAARSGATPPEPSDEVKEIVAQCLAPADRGLAKKQKPKATEADSNSESQSS
jgi:hypothetical protein